MATVKTTSSRAVLMPDGTTTMYTVHVTADTTADIPTPAENWDAGSRCDVLENGGRTFLLNNAAQWEEVHFFGNGGSAAPVDAYTKSEIDAKLEAKVDATEQVGKKYYVDGAAKGEVFNAASSAVGSNSHAEGGGTTASGNYSHAEGCATIALGAFSHAEGHDTSAYGENSHAEGYKTEVAQSAVYAHAEGINTTASGVGSHAEGCWNKAAGQYSHVEGSHSYAMALCSHAGGNGTVANGYAQYVIGKYNIVDEDNKYAFIIGNGTNLDNRSSALAIDWNGNIYVGNSATGVNVLNLLERVTALETEITALKAKVGG